MAIRQRATNYALLTIDETPTPPRGGNGSFAPGDSEGTKYPTPLNGNWADYTAWSPNCEQARGAEESSTSDVASEGTHNVSHEHSMDEASPQTRHITLPPPPAYNDPYASTYKAIQYPTTPYGAPAQEFAVDAPPMYNSPPVYSTYPPNYEMCQCGCGQMIPVEQYPQQQGGYDPAYQPWASEDSSESEPIAPVVEAQQPAFIPRFGPPPPPPVKMAQLLNEHGNNQGDSARYHAVLRWYDKIQEDAPHFAPDVTPMPPFSSEPQFEKTVSSLNEWWKKNFGDRQTQNHQPARSSTRAQQPVQMIKSANLGQYMSYTMYDRNTISTRRT